MLALCAFGTPYPAQAQSNSPYNFTRRFGGSDGDFPTAVIVDHTAWGFPVIVGYTYSTNFPGARPRPGADPNDADIFVTALSTSTGEIGWSVVLGGSSTDIPTAVTTDGFGNVWVVGRTVSTNFPTTNALQTAASGGSDAFLLRIGFDGKVEYSTYLGGSGHDAATGIALITNSVAYTTEVVVVGTTASPDFPKGQTGDPAGIDGFIVCLDYWYGTNVTFSTALRGSDIESPSAVAIDRWGDIYVAGWTRSPNFPVTPGAYRSEISFSNDGEAFVTKLDRSAGSLAYSTFLGIRTASPVVLAVDWYENAFVGGTEQSPFLGARPRAGGTPLPPPTVDWNFESGFFAWLTPSGSPLEIRRYDTSGRDSVRTVTRGVRAVPTHYQSGVSIAGTLGQHPFTHFQSAPQPAPAFSTRPFAACGDESTHLFAFSLYGWLYHVSGLSPTAHPPGVPVPSALSEDRRRADILVQAFTDPPGQVSPVAGLSFVNTYENRFGTNEVIYLRVDGGDVNGQLGSIAVLSGTNIVAAFDGAPRLLALSNLPPALYNLTAIAQNTAGARGTSCPIAFTVLPAPRNDSFYRATHIEGTSYVTNATNEGASGEPTEPSASALYYYAAARRSVWWCWEAPISGPFAIEVTSAEISPQVGVYVGPNLSQLEQIAVAGLASNVVAAFKATAGTHYFISVDSAYSGDFVFRLRPANPPPNDDHTNRLALAGANLAINGSNVDATTETNVYNDGPYSSVWYRWTAPLSGQYLVSVTSSNFLPTFDLRGVTNPGFDLPGFGQSPVSFSAAAGEEFDLRVEGRDGSMGSFSLSISNIASPPNDNFAAATLITSLPAAIPGTAVGATIEPNEPIDGTVTVWYRWTAPSNVTLTAEIDPTYAASIQVYSGTVLSNLTLVAGDFGSRTATFRAEAGKDYYVRLDDYLGVSVGFTFTLRKAQAPANDDFANATVLSGSLLSVLGSNREASLESGEPSEFEESVWYRWVAPSNGHYTIAIESSAGQSLVTPYTGTALSNLTRATIGSQAPEVNFATRLLASTGMEYYLAVSGYAGSGGPFRLRIQPAMPPANDNFANRIALSGLSVATNGTTVDASVETSEPLADSFADKSVWWSWTAPESRKMVVRFSDVSQLLQLRIFSGTTLSALAPVGLASGFYAFVVEAQAAQTYSIQVSGRSAATFTLNVAPLLQPPNDHFTNAFTLTGHSVRVTANGLGATLEPGESVQPFYGGSVWWNWTAPISGRVTLASQGSVYVYTGTPLHSLTNVGESSRPPGSRTFIAHAGETYRIAVYSQSAEPFDLVLTAPALPPQPELASMRRLANGSFEFQFDSIMGQTNVIDASVDLLNWVPISTNFLDCGVLNVLDPSGFPHRFYRARKL